MTKDQAVGGSGYEVSHFSSHFYCFQFGSKKFIFLVDINIFIFNALLQIKENLYLVITTLIFGTRYRYSVVYKQSLDYICES